MSLDLSKKVLGKLIKECIFSQEKETEQINKRRNENFIKHFDLAFKTHGKI